MPVGSIKMARAYCVIEFIKEFPKNYERNNVIHEFYQYMVVPRPWVRTFCRPCEGGRALIKYPEGEGTNTTKKRVENYEEHSDKWETYDVYLHYDIAVKDGQPIYYALEKAKNFIECKKAQGGKDRRKNYSDVNEQYENLKKRNAAKDNTLNGVPNSHCNQKSSKDNSEKSANAAHPAQNNNSRNDADMKELLSLIEEIRKSRGASTTTQQIVHVHTHTETVVKQVNEAYYQEARQVGCKTKARGHDDSSAIPTKKTMETADNGKLDTLQRPATASTSQIMPNEQIETKTPDRNDTGRGNQCEMTMNCQIVRLERYTRDNNYKQLQIQLPIEVYDRMRIIARHAVSLTYGRFQ